MGKRVTVMLFGKMMRKGIQIDADATVGAIVGKNLTWPDGSTVSESQIRNTATASGGGGTTSGGASVTLWSLILNTPAFIKALAALTTEGLVARGVAGAAFTRTITPLDERIVVTDGDGVAGNPVVGLTNWPTVKNSIGAGEAYTILPGHQMIVMDVFGFDGGVLNIDGELVVL